MQFKVGDRAVFPGQGVGEVTSIEDFEVDGDSYQMYVIEMTVRGTPLCIRMPVANAGAKGVRNVIPAEAVERIYDVLRDKDTPADKQTWNRRYREYTNKVNTGDPLEVAAVLRDLCRLKTEKTLSFGERNMFELTHSLIVEEVAIARDVDGSVIEAELEAIFNS